MSSLDEFNKSFQRIGERIRNLNSIFFEECAETIYKTSLKIGETLRNGGKVMVAGNGGSAADAQHFATEFMVRLESDDNRRALPVISLTTDTSLITACSNDLGYEEIFSRQVEGLGCEGDLFLGISTSGRSVNIKEAFILSKRKNMSTVLLTGCHKIKNEDVDIEINVPGYKTSEIQLFHGIAEHIIVEQSLDLIFK